MAMATMNRINISLIFLIMIFMVLPASAIMYASGSSDDSSGSSDSEFSENSFAPDSGCTTDSSGSSDSEFSENSFAPDSGCTTDSSGSSSDGSTDDSADSPPPDFLPPNVDSSSSDGSTDDSSDSSATSTENNTTLPSESPLGNNTANVQGEDLVNIILTIHNQERAAVGVPPLTWSDALAAHAQPWADKVYATGDTSHSSGLADFGNYGENMALGGGPSYAPPSWLTQTWADEKSRYVPGTPMSKGTGHYTQMVDKRSTEVGCGFTSGPGGPIAEYGGTNVLVCQYTPPGNWNSQPPY